MQRSTGADRSWYVRASGGLAQLLGHLWHHLPITLLLACVMSSLGHHKPDWLASTDSFAARFVAGIDRALDTPIGLPDWLGGGEWTFRPSSVRLQWSHGDDAWGKEWVIVNLRPEAHEHFLQRGTPVPRARLACVIDRLADAIADLRKVRSLDPGSPAAWRPVVAIDIDIATVESRNGRPSTAAATWQRLPDEADCLPPRRGVVCQPRTEDDAMRCALRYLRQQALVVGLVYPRVTKESQRVRNNFIRSTCACVGPGCPTSLIPPARHGYSKPAWEPLVYYASANISILPEEAVGKFADSPLPPNQLAETPPPPGLDLAPRFPGLGPMIAATLYNGRYTDRPQPDQWPHPVDELVNHYCNQLRAPGEPAYLAEDDLGPLVGLEDFYDHRDIPFGVVESRIETFDVSPETRQSFPTEATIAFSRLPLKDVYLLSVDTGTTEDKFIVPIRTRMVSGAWLHAATGAAIWSERQEPQQVSGYWSHVGFDVALGIGMLILTAPAGRWPDKTRCPTAHAAVLLLLPPIGAALMFAIGLHHTLSAYVRGEWLNPGVVLMGLALHVYLDAALRQPGGHVPHDATHRSAIDDLLRWVVQIGWVFAIAWAIARGTDLPSPSAPASVAVLVGGLAYVLLARRWVMLPLPVRH